MESETEMNPETKKQDEREPCQRCQELEKALRKSVVATKECGAQTVPPKIRLEEEESEQLQSAMDSAKTPEEVEELAKKTWPNRTFRKTRLVQRSIITSNAHMARVIMVDADRIDSDMRLKSLATHYTSIKSLTGDTKLQAGQMATIEHGENLKVLGKEEQRTGARTLLVSCIKPDPSSTEIIETLGEIRKELQKSETENISMAIAPPEGVEIPTFRKLLECVINGSGITAEICTSRKKMGGKTKTPNKMPKRNREATSTLLVKGPQQKTYAETLKEIKKAMNPEELGVTVKKTAKTQSGDIRIIIREKAEGGRKAFADQIAGKIEGSEVKITTRGSQILIRDLDETVTPEEVRTKIMELTSQSEVWVGEIRKGRFGSYSTIARLPNQAASRLLQKSKIKIGWHECRITEKLIPKLCFKCQRFGHPAKDCTQEGNGKRKCLKCGSDQHIARDCTKEPHCYACKTDGHRADSMSCPEYRAIVKTMRKEKKKPVKEQTARRGPENKNGSTSHASEC